MRVDGRSWNEMRPVQMTPGLFKYPEGSVLIQTGDTWVLCNATVDEFVSQIAAVSVGLVDGRALLDLSWHGIEHLLTVQQHALREGMVRREAGL